MKNLGKILTFLIIFINTIHAGVVASVDSTEVTKGEMVTLSLKLEGENIQQPVIQTICGENVVSTNSQTSIEVVNGKYSKSYVLSYKFLPQKSCEIKPIAVNINGKTEFTKKIKLKVVPQKITKNSPFILSLKTSKKEVFVGESFNVTLLFKQHKDATAIDSKFIPPNLKGFWVKNESKPNKYNEGNYKVTKVVYTLAAQREGTLKISQAQMRIAERINSMSTWGSWVPQIKWQTYFSNELDIKVKKIPSGIDLVGKFTIDAKVDKTSIKPNEAVNLSIELKGNGNLEDIKTLKPNIEGISIFDEKVDVKGNLLTQKIAFVSNKDFVIPSISLRYFDPKTKEIKTIKTKEFKIDVKGSKNKEVELNIKRDNEQNKQKSIKTDSAIPFVWAVVIFVLGVVAGIVLMYFKSAVTIDKKDSFDIKDEKKLLMKLLPYQDDPEVKEFMDKIESNIYSPNKNTIDKKALKELLKRLGIS